VDRDPGRGRRYALSYALAIPIVGLLLVIAALMRPPHADAPETLGPTAFVTIEHATPRPTAPPTAPPTPVPTPLPHAVSARVPERAAPRAVRASGGGRLAPSPSPHRALAKHPAQPKAALASGSSLADGTGDGDGSGDGMGAGAGGGAGTGTGGSGADDTDADAPCGAVDFIPREAPRIVNGTSYEEITATVHFPDGHAESSDFPYPWVYPDADVTDPWSSANLRRANLTVRAQLPPPDADTHRYPDVIRYILDHTRSNGSTVLQECPKPR